MNLDNLKSVKSSRATYPLNFSLKTESNGDLSPVIYVENITNARDLHWNIVNEGTEEIYLEKLDDVRSIDNYHFQLKFRPGTLSDHVVNNSTPIFSVNTANVTWKINVLKDEESHIVYINLLAETIPNGKLELKPNVPLEIIINKITADPVGGARNTNVEFLYNHIHNGTESNNVLSGNRMQHLGIINHDGLRHIPLLVETKGSATILNDGTANDFDIQISNFSNKAIPLSFNEGNKTKFEIVLNAPVGDESGELFLASQNNLAEIELEWHELDNWSQGERVVEPHAISWTMTNKSQNHIESGHSLSLKLKNVKTLLPEGTAKIQINYYDVTGHWDGSLHLDIIKSPLIFKDKRVGIHTNNPQSQLDVRGDTYLNKLKISNANGVVYDGNWIGMASNISGYGSEVFLHIGGIVSGEGSNQRRRIALVADDVVISGKLMDNKGPIMPKGGIILWHGAINDIPDGWGLCDGNNGAPDLRNRFVVGAGNTYVVNEKGGTKDITLSIDQMPAHSHTGNTNNNGEHFHHVGTRGYDSGSSYNGADGSTDDQDISTQKAGKHSHGFTTNFTGGGKPFDNRPPYFALSYIIKL